MCPTGWTWHFCVCVSLSSRTVNTSVTVTSAGLRSDSCLPCVALTRYAPTVPCANMRAHSDIKNILIFEKQEEFFRRPSPSSMFPPPRSESRCFFTCILAHFFFVTHTALRETETHESRMTAWRHWLVTLLPPAPGGYMREERSSFSRGFLFFFFSRIWYFLLHVTSYETRIPTLRGAAPASSAPKHRFPLDTQEHVNSPKV